MFLLPRTCLTSLPPIRINIFSFGTKILTLPESAIFDSKYLRKFKAKKRKYWSISIRKQCPTNYSFLYTFLIFCPSESRNTKVKFQNITLIYVDPNVWQSCHDLFLSGLLLWVRNHHIFETFVIRESSAKFPGYFRPSANFTQNFQDCIPQPGNLYSCGRETLFLTG